MQEKQITLLEFGDAYSWRKVRGGGKVYCLKGEKRTAEQLPDDFINRMDEIMSHYKARKIIDSVYARYIDQGQERQFNELLGDERACLFLKKEILQKLGKLVHSLEVVGKFAKKYGGGKRIKFIPKKFSYSLYEAVLEVENSFFDRVQIPEAFLKAMKREEQLKELIYKASLIIWPGAIGLLMKKGKQVEQKIKRYKFGIHIWNSWVSSTKPPYRMEFLEGKNCVDPSNTLYILDRKMDKANVQKLKSNGYDICYFDTMLRRFSMKRYFKTIYPQVRMMARKIHGLINEKTILAEASLKMMRDYMLWEMFFCDFQVDKFLTIQDSGNISRVLIQKKHGSKCIYIFWSSAYEILSRDDMAAPVRIYYGLMVFDCMISNLISNNFFKKNNNRIADYRDCGTIRADDVYQIKNDPQLCMKIRADLGIPEGKIIISFFDNPIGGKGILNLKEGEQLYSDIYQLLESNEDYFLVFKSRGLHKLSPDKEINELIKRIIGHSRVKHITDAQLLKMEQYTPGHLMGIADLVIGTFTSSAPMEAVAGGVKTVCYLPSERFDNLRFEAVKIPKFCARDYQQLSELAEFWLDSGSDKEFEKIKNNYVKEYIDGYCDGQATNRLKKIIGTIDVEENQLMEQTVNQL